MRNPLLSSSLIIFCLMLFSCSSETKETMRESVEQTVKPVLNRDNLTSQFFTIDTNKDTIILGKSGTKISIPKNSFVNSKGEAVSGFISFELKEAITLKDMVLANLTTMSDDKILESGGMIYVQATANEEQLQIASSKSLGVTIPTSEKKENMMHFSGEVNPETNSINWVNPIPLAEEDKSTSIPKTDVGSKKNVAPIKDYDTVALVNSISIPTISEPKKPLKVAPNDNRIMALEFEDSLLLPELQHYNNVQFRVNDGIPYNPADAAKFWYHVILKEAEKDGEYIIKLQGIENNNQIEREYVVTPVFQGADYTKAMNEYKEKFNQYELKKVELETQRVAAEKARLEAEMLKAEAERKRVEAERQKATSDRRLVANQNQGQKNENKQPVVSNNKDFAYQPQPKEQNQQGLNEFDENINTTAKVTTKGAVKESKYKPRSTYKLKITSLGWVNVDGFAFPIGVDLIVEPDPVQMITQILNGNEKDVITLTLVLKNRNIILNGIRTKGNSFEFTTREMNRMKIPIGEEAILFATAYKDQIPYYETHSFMVAKDQLFSFTLKKTTHKDLQQKLDELL